jgi:hypothetical protein
MSKRHAVVMRVPNLASLWEGGDWIIRAMSSTLTRLAAEFALTSPFQELSTTLGLVAVALVVVLLVRREVTRAAGGAGATARMRLLDLAIVPLLVAAAVVLGTRVAHLAG